MTFKNKYLKYKKKYLNLKSQTGSSFMYDEQLQEAIRRSKIDEELRMQKVAVDEAKVEESIRMQQVAWDEAKRIQRAKVEESKVEEAKRIQRAKVEESKEESVSFDNYPKIESRTSDGKFEAGSARGDGYCSIWAVIIGRSLISEQLFHPQILEELGLPEPTNIQEVIDIIIRIAENILKKMHDMGVKTFPLTDTNIAKWELEQLLFQLKQDTINSISGDAQFKILAYLMNCTIIIKNSEDTTIDKINKNRPTSIRISTNSKHYYTHNVNTNKRVTLITNHWWKHMWTWTRHPIIGENIPVPYIK